MYKITKYIKYILIYIAIIAVILISHRFTYSVYQITDIDINNIQYDELSIHVFKGNENQYTVRTSDKNKINKLLNALNKYRYKRSRESEKYLQYNFPDIEYTITFYNTKNKDRIYIRIWTYETLNISKFKNVNWTKNKTYWIVDQDNVNKAKLDFGIIQSIVDECQIIEK